MKTHASPFHLLTPQPGAYVGGGVGDQNASLSSRDERALFYISGGWVGSRLLPSDSDKAEPLSSCWVASEEASWSRSLCWRHWHPALDTWQDICKHLHKDTVKLYSANQQDRLTYGALQRVKTDYACFLSPSTICIKKDHRLGENRS